MSYDWDLMLGLLHEALRSANQPFAPRKYAEAYAMELDGAGRPVPDLDALRSEAAAYEGHLVNGGFLAPRPEQAGGNGENYVLTARGERLMQLLANDGSREQIRRELDARDTAALLPEVFDELQARLP